MVSAVIANYWMRSMMGNASRDTITFCQVA
jgi:hypothetical protein